jgi:site-specific recombinase XerD
MASLGGFEPTTRCLEGSQNVFKLVNNLTVSQLAELTNFSKPYISNIKNGVLPPSDKFLNVLAQTIQKNKTIQPSYLSLFIQSRNAMGCSPKTIRFYYCRLNQFVGKLDYLSAKSTMIQKYLNSIPANKNGLATRHASFRAIKTFYRWLSTEYGLNNPMKGMAAPLLGKPIMPTLDENQVKQLIGAVDNSRDKAIISLFVESGLRLTELANIKPCDLNWEGRCIKVLGKGRKVALAPFGDSSSAYLTEWLEEYKPDGNIWGMNSHGIATMLRRLEAKTGITCNPHVFRRSFATLLRKAGIDTMTIKELGRWESLEMVQRYTRSFAFADSMKFYKSPLS